MAFIDALHELEFMVGGPKSDQYEQLVARIDLVLFNLDEYEIGNDQIVRMNIQSNGATFIETEYYIRGCHQTNHMTIPAEVATSEDPNKKAIEHRIRKEYSKAMFRAQQAELALAAATGQLRHFENEAQRYGVSLEGIR